LLDACERLLLQLLLLQLFKSELLLLQIGVAEGGLIVVLLLILICLLSTCRLIIVVLLGQHLHRLFVVLCLLAAFLHCFFLRELPHLLHHLLLLRVLQAVHLSTWVLESRRSIVVLRVIVLHLIVELLLGVAAKSVFEVGVGVIGDLVGVDGLVVLTTLVALLALRHMRLVVVYLPRLLLSTHAVLGNLPTWSTSHCRCRD